MKRGQLADKVIVISGGTTGIGISAAQAMVQAGAHVVVVGLDSTSCSSAQELLGADGHALEADARSPATAPLAITGTRETFNGFPGLYHVAGARGGERVESSCGKVRKERGL